MVGDHERVATLDVDPESVVGSIADAYRQVQQLIEVAKTLVAVGERDRAGAFIAEWAQTVTTLVQLIGRTGDVDRAAALIATITLENERAQASALLAGVVGQAGDVDRAESIAHTISDVEQRDVALADLVDALKGAGDLGRAESIARAISDPYRLTWVLIDLAKVSVETDYRQRTADWVGQSQYGSPDPELGIADARRLTLAAAARTGARLSYGLRLRRRLGASHQRGEDLPRRTRRRVPALRDR